MSTTYRRPYTDAEEVTMLTPRTHQGQHTEDLPLSPPKKATRSRRHFLTSALMGGSASLALLLYGPAIVQSLADQWHYGDARISEFFYDVGHSGFSRFLASYFNSSVYITEYSHNADPDHEHTYSFQAPGNDQSQHVVTLEKRVMRGRQNLIVQIENIPVAYVLYNTGTAFQMLPNEQER